MCIEEASASFWKGLEKNQAGKEKCCCLNARLKRGGCRRWYSVYAVTVVADESVACIRARVLSAGLKSETPFCDVLTTSWCFICGLFYFERYGG